MDIFVKRDDNVVVSVFAYEDANNVDATHDRTQVPKSVGEVKEIKFTFRKPTHEDSMTITRSAQIRNDEAGSMDVVQFQNQILLNLCVDWDVTDADGRKVPVTRQGKLNLQPAIARAAVAGALEVIRL